MTAPDATPLMLSYGKILTFFIVMVGPIKLIGPYAKLTSSMEPAQARAFALRGIGFAALGGLAAAVLGQRVLISWQVSLPALLIAAGLVLILVALQSSLSEYGVGSSSVPPAQAAAPVSGRAALSPLAFPYIIPPYGMGVLILLLAASAPARDLGILVVFAVVMLLNLAAMWYAKPILKYGAGALQIVGAVFGVLQIALAVQMLILAGHMLGVLPPARL